MTDYDDLFETTATVRRATDADGDLGTAQEGAFSDSTTGVKGSLQPMTSGELTAGAGISEVGTHWWYCADTVDMKGRDRLKIGTVEYDVLGPGQDHGAMSFGVQRFRVRHREET